MGIFTFLKMSILDTFWPNAEFDWGNVKDSESEKNMKYIVYLMVVNPLFTFKVVPD